jgi:hypothetical protein
MNTPERLAQNFVDEVRAQEARNRAEVLNREKHLKQWGPTLETIRDALTRLSEELSERLNLPGYTLADVYIVRSRLVFDWQSEHGSFRFAFDPTAEGVFYRIEGENQSGYCRDLKNDDGRTIYSAAELACGIVIERLRKLILPRLA